MTERVLRRFAALLLACLVGTAAKAATLEAIQGQVMVNKGNGYRFVSGTVELNPGDMVIANSGGGAQLIYGDGCNVPVQAGAAVTVGDQSPCAAQGGSNGGPALGPGTLALGAVVVGGGIGAAVLLSGQNGDKPVSP